MESLSHSVAAYLLLSIVVDNMEMRDGAALDPNPDVEVVGESAEARMRPYNRHQEQRQRQPATTRLLACEGWPPPPLRAKPTIVPVVTVGSPVRM